MIPPGNIWSGDPARACFTNPTEIAFFKGMIKKHYPVYFNGLAYQDAEHAYNGNRPKSSDNIELMIDILMAKFKQHPELYKAITDSGGLGWISQCSHTVYGKSEWEGQGLESPFILCLWLAYSRLGGV